MAYAMELPTKALAAVDAGRTQEEVAAVLQVSTRWVSGLVTKRRRGESLAPGQLPGQPQLLFQAEETRAAK